MMAGSQADREEDRGRDRGQVTLDREQLDAAQRMAHLGSWEWNVQTGRISWSDELYRIFGLRPGEVEPTWQEVQDRFHPEDRPEVVRKVETAIEACGSVRHEARIVQPDGEIRTVEFWATVAGDEDGRPAVMRGATLDITERQRLEQQHRVQARLLDQADVAMVAADASARVTHWSAGAAKLFGRAADDALGKTIDELRLTSGSVSLDAIREKLDQGEDQWDGEFVIRRADGASLPVYGTISVLRNARGGVESYVGVAIDRTRQEEATRALAVQRALTQGLIDNVRAMVYAKDREHRYLFVNRRLADFFEIGAEEAVGKTDLAVLGSEEEALAVQANDDVVLGTEEPIDVEEHAEHEGRERTFLSHKFPLFDDQGNCFAIGGVSSDITEKVESERVLRQRAEQQAVVAELGTLATKNVRFEDLARRAVSETARLLEVEFVKVLELDKERATFLLRAAHGFGAELVGAATVPATDQTQAGYTLRAEGPVVVEDLPNETRFKGAALLHQHRIQSGVSVPIRVEAGKSGIFGILSAHSSERRIFDEQAVDFVTAVATVLATAIARERADVLRRQLEQAQRLEALGKLAGGVAHDFNNLLAVITNYAAFVEGELKQEGTASVEDVGEIRKAGERAAELTRQLLVFSRREVVQPEVLNVNRVIAEAEGLLRRTIGEDIDLEVRLADGLPNVRLGAGQFEQVLMNLCVNARDAMPTGGLLSIATEEARFDWPAPTSTGELSPGAYVRVTVADTGTGMEGHVASQIFEPFFTTKVEGEGTGLGLATTYGIVREHGGRIQVYSEPGKGTVFKLYFPVSSDAAPDSAAPAAKSTMGSGQTILVVEDEAAVRRLTAKILKGGGYSVVEAAGPEEALEAIGKAEVDLLLTDVVMPGMSGREVAEHWRRAQPDLPVLFMSGYTGDVISRHGMLGGEVTVIEKPFSADRLLSAIDQALSS